MAGSLCAAASARADFEFGPRQPDGGRIVVSGNLVSFIDGNGQTLCSRELPPPRRNQTIERLLRQRLRFAQRDARRDPPCTLAKIQCSAGALSVGYTVIFHSLESVSGGSSSTSQSFANESGWVCDCESPVSCRYVFSGDFACGTDGGGIDEFIQQGPLAQRTCP